MNQAEVVVLIQRVLEQVRRDPALLDTPLDEVIRAALSEHLTWLNNIVSRLIQLEGDGPL